MTYHLDNEDGLINLYRYDRTDHNHMAYTKGDSVGKLMAIIVNELDHLPKYESLSQEVRPGWRADRKRCCQCPHA